MANLSIQVETPQELMNEIMVHPPVQLFGVLLLCVCVGFNDINQQIVFFKQGALWNEPK